MPDLDPNERITIACPGVLKRAVVKRSALRVLSKGGWYEVGPDAPTSGKQAQRARKTAAAKADTAQAEPNTAPSGADSPALGEKE